MQTFTVEELTLSLLRVPYMPGAVGRLGLFQEKRQSVTTATIEVQGTRLALVPDMPRGAPPTPDVLDRPFIISMKVPHFPARSVLFADAVQDARAFGTERLNSFRSAVDECIGSLGRRLDLTLEHLRLGAVRGVIVTAIHREDGSPLRSIDVFDAFGVVPQPPLDWPIIDAGRIGQEREAWSGQLTELINHVGRLMADELPGGQLFGVHGFCGHQFFDAVAQHPERRAAYIAVDSAPITRPILGTQVSFRNITFEEYRGRVGGVEFVKPDECHFFPTGVADLFIECYAPADYTETVNTVALPRYAKAEPMEFDKGMKLEAQMNTLPLCTSPRSLFTAKATPYTPDAAFSATRERVAA